jgi:hypothetical protein
MMPSEELVHEVEKLPLRVGQRKDRNPYLAAWDAGGELAKRAHRELTADLEAVKGSIMGLAERNAWHKVTAVRVVAALGLDEYAAKLRADNNMPGPTRGHRKPKKRIRAKKQA